MFFSIIIPLYNRPQEIDELLHTLTQQTYQQFEVLVIEDGSVNRAEDIVCSYSDKLDIRYYFKENSGQGFTRNYGFELAKGDYFVVFDSDCLIPADYLDTVKDYLYEHQLDAYGGPDRAHDSFTPVQKAISYAMTSPFTTGGIRGNKKHIGQFHPRSFNMGISREVWEKTGGFILTRLGEDIEFSIRIHSLGFKIGLIAGAIVYHKRRTDFFKFYKQLHFFGRARINIYKHFPSQLKAVHFFPAAFTIFLLASLILNLLQHPLRSLCNGLVTIYILLIFFHAWTVNKSAKVALLSIIASFVQLIAYGLGFMQDFGNESFYDTINIMDKSISVREVLSDAWELAKKNVWILLGFTAIQFVFIFIITAILGSIFGSASPAGVLVQNLLLSLFDAFFTVAFYQVFFKLIDDPTEPEFPDFIPNLMKALNFVLVKLIIGLILVFLIAIISSVYFINTLDIDTSNPLSWDLLPVFILIAIPIIYFTIRLCFVVCFIVDQDSGSSESISQSWTLTKGHFMFILTLFLIMLGLNFLGAATLLIGLLFTVPFSSIILIIAYRHMVNSYTDEEDILLEDQEEKNEN